MKKDIDTDYCEFHTKPWQHITPTLIHLHWLPVKSRISYKVLLLTYKSLHALALQYLSDNLHPHAPPRTPWAKAQNNMMPSQNQAGPAQDPAAGAVVVSESVLVMSES